jgi:hypothetical protein
VCKFLKGIALEDKYKSVIAGLDPAIHDVEVE